MNDKPFGIIYKATNIVNQKVYIGQTVQTLDKRKSQHERMSKNNPKFYFHGAILKYGADNFIWEKVFECTSSDHLNEIETKLISDFNSQDKNFGYNIDIGGKGCKRSLDTIKKMILSRTGKKISEETKKKISLAMSGENCMWHGTDGPMFNKKHSEETKKKMSEKRKGMTHSLQTREKIKNLKTKKVINTETGCVYESTKIVSELLNMNITTLRAMLNGSNKNKTNYKYYEYQRNN
jgi:group I intron endonuclease